MDVNDCGDGDDDKPNVAVPIDKKKTADPHCTATAVFVALFERLNAIRSSLQPQRLL